jgi:selenocysteine lyase/cysteine desulfurase
MSFDQSHWRAPYWTSRTMTAYGASFVDFVRTPRAFLNAPKLEEVIFTRNATEAINVVAYTFGRERIKRGRLHDRM